MCFTALYAMQIRFKPILKGICIVFWKNNVKTLRFSKIMLNFAPKTVI